MKTPPVIVGAWYKDTIDGWVFEIVAADEDARTIEVQHIDGEINQFDFSMWSELSIEPINAPKDWRNGYELSSEDSVDNEAVIHPDNGANPLTGIEPQVTNGLIDD